MARQRRLAFLATNNNNTFRLVVFLVLVCLVTALVRRVSQSFFKESRPGVEPPAFQSPPRITTVVHGRWSSIRASLGLPPLSHEIVLVSPPEPDKPGAGAVSAASPSPTWPEPPPNIRASRFDLANKRRQAEAAARRLPRLRFAAPNAQPAQQLNERKASAPRRPPTARRDTKYKLTSLSDAKYMTSQAEV